MSDKDKKGLKKIFGCFGKKKKLDKNVNPEIEKEASAAEVSSNDECLEDKTPHKKSGKRRLKLVIFAAILIIIILIVLFIMIKLNKNDGERIAAALSEKLGSTPEKAAVNADITLKEQSDYSFINALDEFSDVYESDKTIEINGINVPEWVILCYTDKSGKLIQVSFYDYEILKKSINGTKMTKKIDISLIEEGMSLEDTESILGLKPIKVIRDDDDKKILTYKYYCKENGSKDEKVYYISVMLNFDDKVMGIKEEEDELIQDILSAQP